VTPLQALHSFLLPGVQPLLSSSLSVLIVQLVTKRPTHATLTKSFHIERLLFIDSILLGSGKKEFPGPNN
jgi:hypothetical protein